MNKLLLILLFAASTATAQLTGKVVRVHDGDTFTMVDSLGDTTIVRLQGIDCPELHQPYGYQARRRTNQLIYGRTVQVQAVTKDKYRRTIGIVSIGGQNLNMLLLREGLAWHYKKYDNSAYAASLEENARETKTGIWSLPVAPWVWRHKKMD